MRDKKYRILIAEDDRDIVNLLELYLENAGYEVLTAENGLLAWQRLQQDTVDLIIMDIMMPEMDGYQLIRKVRESMNVPVIILSAKTEDSDKILGLDLGADDYIAKPFNPLEVAARVRSNIRRFYHLNEHSPVAEVKVLETGELKMNLESMTLRKGEREIMLTPTEFKILRLLMQHPGKVFTKLQIYESINGEYFESDDNTIMVHISKIREKIEDEPKNPVYLKTIRGLGYKIEKNI